MENKKSQLGMNPSTASARLVKDLLFNYAVQSGHKCHRCKGELTRETFSIEHIIPWMDSEDPVKLFFDLENIAYSHLVCNVSASRGPLGKTTIRKGKITHGTSGYRKLKCRCDICKQAYSVARKERYIRTKKYSPMV